MKVKSRALFKTTLNFLLLLIISGAFFFGWKAWQNNRYAEVITPVEVNQHFNQSVAWLENNYSTIENNHNPILWWMIKQAAENSNNEILKAHYIKYKTTHLDTSPSNLSTPMFDKFYRPRVPDISALSSLQDYQIFFFYGLSCDDDLSSEPTIQRQLAPDFCSLHFVHSRCITHQLMGLRFMQRYQCGYEEKVNLTINALQNDVISELTWDFRVGDAYIQRVLMLVDTGAYKKIKPIWIKNILEAQNKDGSWDDLDPILYLGNDYVFAFTSRLPTVKKATADFHATAQAIWLLSLLRNETTN